jgi:hypothetical protein
LKDGQLPLGVKLKVSTATAAAKTATGFSEQHFLAGIGCTQFSAPSLNIIFRSKERKSYSLRILICFQLWRYRKIAPEVREIFEKNNRSTDEISGRYSG